ncbi:MAG: hypothetical protein AAF638_12505, partial [Pseudomonadota bacterium]
EAAGIGEHDLVDGFGHGKCDFLEFAVLRRKQSARTIGTSVARAREDRMVWRFVVGAMLAGLPALTSASASEPDWRFLEGGPSAGIYEVEWTPISFSCGPSGRLLLYTDEGPETGRRGDRVALSLSVDGAALALTGTLDHFGELNGMHPIKALLPQNHPILAAMMAGSLLTLTTPTGRSTLHLRGSRLALTRLLAVCEAS